MMNVGGRKPRELYKGTGASAGKTVIPTKERGRVLNLPMEESVSSQKKGTKPWMRKGSNMHINGHTGSAGSNTVVGGTIDDVLSSNNLVNGRTGLAQTGS